MATSIFLAKLIGPVALVLGLGAAGQPRRVPRASREEFLRSRALIFLVRRSSPCRPGSRIVLDAQRLGRRLARHHHAPRLALRHRAARSASLAPQQAAAIGRRMIAHRPTLLHRQRRGLRSCSALILCFFGYFTLTNLAQLERARP